MTQPKTDDETSSLDHQRSLFERGTQYTKLLRAATLKEGIHSFNNADRKDFIRSYEARMSELDIVKFVPASGAATRMFRNVYQWVEAPKKHRKAIDKLFKQADYFPFFGQWKDAADSAKIGTFEGSLEAKVKWLKLLLDDGLKFATKPKGLIPFHVHNDISRSPLFEHIAEAIAYAEGKEKAHIHFTISENLQSDFEKEVESILGSLDLNDRIQVDYSFQNESTHIVSVDEYNAPLMNDKGDAVMRPGGHGALIHNLNTIDADIVFIKNIDNVCHPRLLDLTAANKKYLAGILLSVRDDFQSLYDQVSKGLLDATNIEQARDKWRLRIPRDYQKLKEYLKRPIRVCGMVKNDGETGGGPFWSLDKYTGESLQIVESAQVNTKEMRQEMILNSSTHFNPVDLVCSVRDYKGSKIDLTDFIDENQYFISEKTMNGQPIKALEWPGLWNGGMAHWVTVFVEVPSATFSPVKEVSDLLRTNHLSS
jgi:hypothetical protein